MPQIEINIMYIFLKEQYECMLPGSYLILASNWTVLNSTRDFKLQAMHFKDQFADAHEALRYLLSTIHCEPHVRTQFLLINYTVPWTHDSSTLSANTGL